MHSRETHTGGQFSGVQVVVAFSICSTLSGETEAAAAASAVGRQAVY